MISFHKNTRLRNAALNKRGQYDPYKIYTSETIDLDYHAKYR